MVYLRVYVCVKKKVILEGIQYSEKLAKKWPLFELLCVKLNFLSKGKGNTHGMDMNF